MGCRQRRTGPPNPGPSGMPPAPTNGSNPITPHTTAPNPHPSHGLQRFPYPYFVIRSFIYPLFHPPSIPDLSSSSSFSTFSSSPPIIMVYCFACSLIIDCFILVIVVRI